MNGRKKASSKKEVEEAFLNPIGMGRIKDEVRGRICILFDDITRGTKVYELLGPLFKELRGRVDDVVFIAATGAHAPMDLEDHVRKLGKRVVENHPVFNHHPYDCCERVGVTSYGTPVILNKEYLSCDYRIGIGAVVPHIFMGFGGGGKIVLPGISHADTIVHNHRHIPREGSGIARYQGNPYLKDVEEALSFAPLDVKIDVLVNHRCDTVKVLVGRPMEVFKKGVSLAIDHYKTPFKKGDVVIANACFKVNEAPIAMGRAFECVKEGGDVVVVAHTPRGQIVHYLIGFFGKGIGGKLKRDPIFPEHVDRIIVLSPLKDLASEEYFTVRGRILWTTSWDETLELLREKFKDRAEVVIIPDGTVQYFSPG